MLKKFPAMKIKQEDHNYCKIDIFLFLSILFAILNFSTQRSQNLCRGGQGWVQAARRSCGVSIPGD